MTAEDAEAGDTPDTDMAARDIGEGEDPGTDDQEVGEFESSIKGDEDLTAIIRLLGKQFKVRSGDFLVAPHDSSCEFGDTIEVFDVLLAENDGTVVGSPTIDGAKVSLEPVIDMLGPKTISFKKRRRKHSSKTVRGGRQSHTGYVVAAIDIPGLGQSHVE